MKNRKNNGRLLRDITYGMVGGLLGTLVMEQVASLMYKFESEEKKQKEESLRPEAPFDVMARRLAGAIAIELSDESNAKLGQAIHWGTGIGFGGLYGALHDRVPPLSKVEGLPYGIAFWLVVDEGLNTALKLTPPPQKFPIDAHVRGLVAHLVYAATADGTFRVLRKFVG
jgi:uncharacterized membrane protein YagU involved in acid resistance